VNVPVTAAIAASLILAALSPLHVAHGTTGMLEPTGINIATNETTYVFGEAVQVTVQVLPPLDLNNLLVMRVYTPGGDIFRIDEFTVNSDGRFVWTFNLPPSQAGQWTINAKFSTKDVDATINVLETEVFDKIFIESTTLLNVQGNATTSGRAGENIVIAATLVNEEPVSQPYIMIVQIIDEEGAAISLSLTIGSLAADESASPSVSWLPRQQGSYTAQIFVWTSVDGPTPLVERHAVTFSVA
jgi:hypothetical protein